MMEDESNIPESSGDWLSETKNWIQDNIRVVLSIVIVLAIALGVYSYSKRGAEEVDQQLAEETTEETDLQKLIEEQGEQIAQDMEDETTQAMEEVKEVAEGATEEPAAEEPAEEPMMEEPAAEEPAVQPEQPQAQPQEEPQPEPIAEEEPSEPQVQPQEETVVSQNNDSYEVTAAKGDSLTTLARSAVKQYLDSNQDSSITAEHKIYMEDYLAKKMGYSHHLNVGETKSFSQNDIASAVEAARQLTPSQLDHLRMYSQRVSNL